jgi:hypothetical protein
MASKQDEPFNFRKWGFFEVEEIKALVNKFSDEWLIDTSRQETYEVHRSTNSYFLYQTDLNWEPSESFIVTKHDIAPELEDLVEPIISELEGLHDGQRGNVLFIKLKAGQSIASHQDGGYYLDAARRHHIAIVTSSGTRFGVGDEEISMAQGDVWEINNSRLHYVNNSSDTDRVHLLIDILPNSKL